MRGTSIISTGIGENKYVDLKDKIEAAIELGYPIDTIQKLITAHSMVATNNIMAEARHNWNIQPSIYMHPGCSIPRLSLDQAHSLLIPLQNNIESGVLKQISNCIYVNTFLDTKHISDKYIYYNNDNSIYSVEKDEKTSLIYIVKWNNNEFIQTNEITFADLLKMSKSYKTKCDLFKDEYEVEYE